jgi:hypothetical protein
MALLRELAAVVPRRLFAELAAVNSASDSGLTFDEGRSLASVDVDRAWREAAVEESEFLREDELQRMVARALEGVDRELAAGKLVPVSTVRLVAAETGTAVGEMIAGRAADIADVLESRARPVLRQRQETDSQLVRER